MLRFFIQPLPGQPTECLVEGDEAIIGRSASAEVRLGSKFVSRAHARVLKTDDGLSIEDLGSHNGTKLNGQTIEGREAVEAGDVLHIGSFAVTVDEIASSVMVASHVSSHSSVVLSGIH